MIDKLKLELTDTGGNPKTVLATKEDGSTFSYTPSTCGTNGACALNGDTKSADGFYSWYAATADSSIDPTTSIAEGSICPNNWKLPNGYSNLLHTYYTSPNRALILVYPLSFTQSGVVMNGSIVQAGTTDNFWTSVQSSNTSSANRLGYNTGGEWYLDYQAAKYYGLSIRCIAL